MQFKSDRLKKLETELNDLQQWQKLGLVPKRDLQKHQSEIDSLSSKIDAEKERIRALRESGDIEEIQAPRKGNQQRANFSDAPTFSEFDQEANQGNTEFAAGETEAEETQANTTFAASTVEEGSDETTVSDDDDEDPFSDKARWRRGIPDPDSDDEW